LLLGGRLEDRALALRAVAEACKLVVPAPRGRAWVQFQSQVLSAVGEGFNNAVMHGSAGRKEARVELRIHVRRGWIRIELRDWGPGFDPATVHPPVIETLPEGGLGLHIMQSFMTVSYRSGRPNQLTLSKRLPPLASEGQRAKRRHPTAGTQVVSGT
jgi:anti-sigma regulatory factor (Ser/Thr protein kinase)